MSEVEEIKLLVNQRLTAVAEEIVGLFEKTFAEYRDHVARLVEETQRQRRQLDSVLAAAAPSQHSESQQVLAIKETPPEQQTLGVSLNHEHVGAPYIKEEQEEIWCSQQGEQFEGVKEFPFSYIPLKSERREEQENNSPCTVKLLHGDFQQLQKCNEEVASAEHKWRPALKEEPEYSQSQVEQESLRRSQEETRIDLGENLVTELPFIKREADEEEAQLHENAESSDCQSTEHMQVESDGDGCGGAEPPSNAASERTSDSSDSETEDSDDDWKRTHTKRSFFKVMVGNSVVKSQPVQESDPSVVREEKTNDSSENETEDSDSDLSNSNKSKSSSTSVLSKEALLASSSKVHTEKNSHSRQQLKNCTSTQTAQMPVHGSQSVLQKANSGMRTSSTKRLLSNSKKFKKSASPKAQNTKDKCFTCQICNKSFQLKAHLALHMKMHKVSPKVSGAHEPV